MSKGSAQQAGQTLARDRSIGDTYGGYGTADRSKLLPFLQNELTNPQGFGQEELSKMQTQGGQAVSGALGQGKEDAELLASRTGNPAAAAGVIDATSRNAMKQQSDNALDIDARDAALRQQQQQSGAAGLSSLYGEDTAAALKSLGLEDESINAWTGARKPVNDAYQDIFKDASQVAGTALGV